MTLRDIPLIVAAIWLFALLMVASCISAYGAPPPGPVDPAIALWFQSLTVPDNPVTRENGSANGGCCSMADCRPVQYRQDQDGYEILIGPQFPGVTDPFWMRVPPESIITHKDNPMGEPVACFYNRKIRCFVAPSEG